MSGKVLRTEETWEIVEQLSDELTEANNNDEDTRWEELFERYRTALRFHSWPHELTEDPFP